jgi:hypothetical protein
MLGPHALAHGHAHRAVLLRPPPYALSWGGTRAHLAPRTPWACAAAPRSLLHDAWPTWPRSLRV